MKDLAKEYAALVPEWAEGKPGVACRDPETGDVFRLVVTHGSDQYWARSRNGHGGPTCVGLWRPDESADRSCFRAIAAGPDLDDKATLGALLLGLGGEYGLWCGLDNGVTTWRCSDGSEYGRSAPSRAEAIIRACIAQAKEEP